MIDHQNGPAGIDFGVAALGIKKVDVQCIMVVALPPGARPAAVSLIVRQDGRELARDSAVMPPDSPIAMASLWIDLEREK